MNQKIISENLFPESRLLKKLKSKIYPVITQLRSREEKVLNKFKLKLEKRNITFNIVEGLG